MNIAGEPETVQTRPPYKQMFCPLEARKHMKEAVEEFIARDAYSKSAEIATGILEIANKVKTAIKEDISNRYKVMVQVVMGEKLGQGIQIGSKCFWDQETDNMTSYSFVNDAIFCLVVAYVNYSY